MNYFGAKFNLIIALEGSILVHRQKMFCDEKKIYGGEVPPSLPAKSSWRFRGFTRSISQPYGKYLDSRRRFFLKSTRLNHHRQADRAGARSGGLYPLYIFTPTKCRRILLTARP